MTARFLLVLVAVLQVIWLGETWWWTVATMVAGVFAIEWLRPEEHCRCGATEDDHADQDECPGGAQ